jgi:hypothetical protein
MVVLMAGCAATGRPAVTPAPRLVVAPSAAGWSCAIDGAGETVLTHPNRAALTVGQTPADETIVPSYLFGVRSPVTNEEHLVVYAPPVASAPSTMVVLRLRNGRLERALEIRHKYETPVAHPRREPHLAVPDFGVIALARLIFPGDDDARANAARSYEVGRRTLPH